MDMRWFYVSLLFLFAILFNHTVLPSAVPTAWQENLSFWLVVFSSDAVFFIGAFAFLAAALLSRSGDEEDHAPE